MAFTATVVQKTVFGNMRVHMVEVTADANSGVVDTGLDVIHAVQASPVSCATFSRMKFKKNLAEDGSTASNGNVFVSSATNGDDLVLVCYGR